MIIPVFVVFTNCAILAIAQPVIPRNSRMVNGALFFIGITLILIATFRPSEMPDYENYFDFFNYPDFFGERFEIGFKEITKFIHKYISSNPLSCFFTFALLSIIIKLLAIRKMSPFFWGTMALYVGGMFILHDMIQIRCAIASGIMLWAVKYVYERDLKRFVCCCLLAISFHYSAALIIPIWFLGTARINKKLYALIIPLSYTISLTGIMLSQYLTTIDIPAVQILVNMYINADDTSNIFNALQLLRCALSYFMLWKIDTISKQYPLSILLCKIYIVSIAIVPLFSDIAALSFRASEFLQIIEILFIPSLVFAFKQRFIGKSVVITFAVVLLLLQTFYMNILL